MEYRSYLRKLKSKYIVKFLKLPTFKEFASNFIIIKKKFEQISTGKIYYSTLTKIHNTTNVKIMRYNCITE